MTIHDPTNPNHAAQNLIDSLISLRFMAGVDLVFKLGKAMKTREECLCFNAVSEHVRTV